MNISFIIPLYNEEKTILRCLLAIKGQLEDGDEIIIVDNGSTDESLAVISSLQNVRVVRRPGITIGAVRNAGAALAKGQLLAFIDADCVIRPKWRDSVIDTFANDQVGASGSKVNIPDEALWIEKAWYSQRQEEYRPVSYINSGNFVVRRGIFEEMGGFREDLTTGEDSELGWRINKAGYAIFDNPGIKSIHLGNPTTLNTFYKKEKWHALGMMGTFEVSFVDKPLIMTVMFAISNLIAGVLLFLFLVQGNTTSAFALPAALIGLVPVTTVLYRVKQFGNARYFLELVLLYWIYYMARANVLILLCWGWRKRQKSTAMG
jgi:GT2 family glycosyltransferase